MNIKILDAAKEDLIRGFNFYEGQDFGLGEYFLDSLYSDIDSLQLYAGTHTIKFKKYYCMLAAKFPFAIYYRLVAETIYVYAVLDCRQDPNQTIARFS